MINIEPFKKYNKKEIMEILSFNDSQLKKSEQVKYLIFFEGYMYGVYFFQFLRSYSNQLEDIQCSK
jgi:hypothetical protein